MQSVLTRLCYAKSFALCRGMGALAPMVTAVWQCQNPHQAHPRSALLKRKLPAFAPEKQGCSARVTQAHPHALAHAVNDRTDMPRRGQLEPAAQAAHALGRCASEHTSGGFSLRSFFNFFFFVTTLVHP